MGGSPATSACNPRGETWDVRDLYVCDGSAFPTASGVNPMISIESIAHMNASALAASHALTALARTRPFACEKRGIGNDVSVLAVPRGTDAWQEGRQARRWKEAFVAELNARDTKLVQYLNEALTKEKQLEQALQATSR